MHSLGVVYTSYVCSCSTTNPPCPKTSVLSQTRCASSIKPPMTIGLLCLNAGRVPRNGQANPARSPVPRTSTPTAGTRVGGTDGNPHRLLFRFFVGSVCLVTLG